MSTDELRAGVELTNLDQPLFSGAGATKRELIDYLDAMHEPMIAGLSGRPLSVVRALRGQAPFMQKNLPKYAPDWIAQVPIWAAASKREVHYPLCNDRRTLLWYANQRAVEYHVTLTRVDEVDEPDYLVLDIDPPEGAAFEVAVRAAGLVRAALDELGLAGAVKTSGAKGVHIFVPVCAADREQVAAATRALAARAEQLDPTVATTEYVRADRDGKVFLDSTRAGGATVVAAYSPRLRAGSPVSFPLDWDELDQVVPGDFTLHTAPALLAGRDRWAQLLPDRQRLPDALIEQGRQLPIARVQAMHAGKRRARDRKQADGK
ncbi:MAG: ATP-dependent DNA ligase [Jatrophihabitantaceae bacterium]